MPAEQFAWAAGGSSGSSSVAPGDSLAHSGFTRLLKTLTAPALFPRLASSECVQAGLGGGLALGAWAGCAGTGSQPPQLCGAFVGPARALQLPRADSLSRLPRPAHVLCSYGVHVLIKLAKVCSPPELAFITDQVCGTTALGGQQAGAGVQARLSLAGSSPAC